MALLLGLGCSGSDRTKAHISVVDSAGVRIVTTPGGVRPAELWTVGPDVLVKIGSADGAQAGQDLFRVAGVVRLSDGSIVVANSGTNELRWYDKTGTFLFARGGGGNGPGEYNALRTLLRMRGDSVVAADILQQRANLYTPGGELVRSWLISPQGPSLAPPPFAALADGTFLAQVTATTNAPSGLIHTIQAIVRYRDGAVIDTVITVPGGDYYLVACGPDTCGYPVPYPLESLAAASASEVFVANGSGYSIRSVSSEGRLRAIYRRPQARQAITASRVSGFVDSLAAAYPSDQLGELRKAMASVPHGDSMPSFVDLRVDDESDLWVELPMPETDGRSDWDVFDSKGLLRSRAVMPRGLQVESISGGGVLGVVKDDNGVEYVVMLPIHKRKLPGGAS